jgi:hypothetical protein
LRSSASRKGKRASAMAAFQMGLAAHYQRSKSDFD